MPGPLSTPLYWDKDHHFNDGKRHGSTFEGGVRRSGKTVWDKSVGKWQRCRANKYKRTEDQ